MVEDSGYVFISYARQDERYASQLANEIEARGFRVSVVKTSVRQGNSWASQVEQVISSASAIVVLVSPNYLNSFSAQSELSVAQKWNASILALVLDDSVGLPEGIASLPVYAYHEGKLLDGSFFDALSRIVPTDLTKSKNYPFEQTTQQAPTEQTIEDFPQEFTKGGPDIRQQSNQIPDLDIDDLLNATEQDQQQTDDTDENESPPPPPAPRTRYAPAAFRTMPDSAARTDTLGFKEYSDALANTILAKETEPPLVIGIYGQWGSGKSTLMGQVRDKINALADQKRNDKDDPTRIISISYDAWAYSDADKLWAGLVKQIAAELDKQMTRRQRFMYGLTSLRKLANKWTSRLIIAMLFGLIVAGLGLIAVLLEPYIAAIGTVFTTIISALLLQDQPVSRAIGGIAAKYDAKPAAGVINDIQEELRRAITPNLSDGDNAAPPATIESRRREVRNAAKKTKIIVYIDELDRCPLERIVDILEAIKLFLAEDIFIVLMAVDTRVVSEAIRLHYEKVDNPDLPREYLEKIVQIPLPVPRANEEGVTNYVNSLMQVERAAPQSDHGAVRPPVGEDVPDVNTDDEPIVSEGGGEASPVAEPRLENVPHLPDTITERDMLIRLGTDLLESNPRRIKRLLNTFRYIRYLAHESGEPIGDDMRMLVWLAYTMRWPVFLADAMDEAESYAKDMPLQKIVDRFTDIANERGVELPSKTTLGAYPTITAAYIVKQGNFANNFLIESVPGLDGWFDVTPDDEPETSEMVSDAAD